MAEADLKTQLGLLDESQVAALREMALSSLRSERSRGEGPPYQKMGRRVFYPIEKLRAYLAARTVIPGRTPTMISGIERRRKPPARAKQAGRGKAS